MKERVKNIIQKTRYSYRSLPDKKQYIEFFTALLSVPVLITVIVLNINNLRGSNKPAEKISTPTPVKEIVYIPTQNSDKDTSDTKPQALELPKAEAEQCKKEIGPVDITTPKEGESVMKNPVDIVIDYEQGNYCAVVWSYRINNGSWSEYDDKSFALYNLPKGQIIIDLKVKSIVNGDEKTLKRTFSYEGPSLEPTKTASSSAN